LTIGFASIEEAFAAADADTGEATPVAAEETMPVTEAEAETPVEQAPALQDEHPDVADTTDTDVDTELQALVDEIGGTDEAEAETPAAEPVTEFLASDDFWSTEIEVDVGDGLEAKTVQELVDGFLRQGDYTKKTQAVADARKSQEEAVEFHRVFEEDPMAFAYTLAVKAGLVEEGAQPAKPMDVAKFVSPEDAQAEVDRLVEERFTSDPRFTEMEASASKRNVDTAFTALEQERGVTLSEGVRQRLIDLAVSSGTADLVQVFDAEMYRKQLARTKADVAKRKAPSRPTKSGAVVNDDGTPTPVADIDDAYQRAIAELGLTA